MYLCWRSPAHSHLGYKFQFHFITSKKEGFFRDTLSVDCNWQSVFSQNRFSVASVSNGQGAREPCTPVGSPFSASLQTFSFLWLSVSCNKLVSLVVIISALFCLTIFNHYPLVVWARWRSQFFKQHHCSIDWTLENKVHFSKASDKKNTWASSI